MPYDSNVLRRATQRLEDESRRRRERTERLRLTAYEKEPRLEQLDRRIQGTMAGLVAATLRQGGDPVEAVRAVREENQGLRRERAVLPGGFQSAAGGGAHCDDPPALLFGPGDHLGGLFRDGVKLRVHMVVCDVIHLYRPKGP